MKQKGRYGTYGGFYVPEVLIPAIEEIEAAFLQFQNDASFVAELNALLTHYAGRPTPLYHAKRFSEAAGCSVWLKREDLPTARNRPTTPSDKGCWRYMGKEAHRRDRAGQHGLATAMVGALFGMETKIFMGSVDVARQNVNVHKMKLLGAEVIPVSGGTCTLKDAINEAMRYWTANVDAFYLFGTAGGPHPFPMIVRHFQAVIGAEARRQCLDQIGRLPDIVAACVGGGSNAIGIFSAFLDDAAVKLVGVEGGGKGLDSDHHCATLNKGRPGILHGSQTYVLQDEHGQIHDTECISAGLDYPGVGPEHAYLKDTGRASYVAVSDEQVLDAFALLTRLEGIMPALESSHALAWLLEQKDTLPPDTVAVVNMSGRGDKDIGIVEEHRPIN